MSVFLILNIKIMKKVHIYIYKHDYHLCPRSYQIFNFYCNKNVLPNLFIFVNIIFINNNNIICNK